MLKYKKLHEDAKAPIRGSQFASGFDLSSIEDADIPPGKSAILGTGLAMEIKNGCVGLIWPRSKLGAKKQIQVLAGVVDSDYRGEVMIALLNSGDKTLEVRKGDKIAQMLIQVSFIGVSIECDQLSNAERGSKGINCDEMRIR